MGGEMNYSGLLKTTGVAKREVQYNVLKIVLEFFAEGKTSREALSQTREESDEFLKELCDFGIDISKIEVGKNKLERPYSYKDEILYRAERVMTINAEYELTYIDLIQGIVEKKGYQVEITFVPLVSNECEIEDELKQLALLDAQKKAELSAKTLGITILGIESVDLPSDDFRRFKEDNFPKGEIIKQCSVNDFEDEENALIKSMYTSLKVPTVTINAEADVYWKINK